VEGEADKDRIAMMTRAGLYLRNIEAKLLWELASGTREESRSRLKEQRLI
jgi:hypothetical protein